MSSWIYIFILPVLIVVYLYVDACLSIISINSIYKFTISFDPEKRALLQRAEKRKKIFGALSIFLTPLVVVIMIFIWRPSDFSEGKNAFEANNWWVATEALSKVEESSSNYADAQEMLLIAKTNIDNQNFEFAKKYSFEEKNWGDVIYRLSDISVTNPNYQEASKMLAFAKDASEKQMKELEKELEKEKMFEGLPSCDSDEGKFEVINGLRKAPLGRVYGLEIIKINNIQMVGEYEGVRSCRGVAFMNNGNSYVVAYSFYIDSDGDRMIKANVLGF